VNSRTARKTRWQRNRRQARLAAGLCVDWGEPADGCCRCPSCRRGVNAHRRYVTRLASLGQTVLPNLRDAAHERRLPVGEVHCLPRVLVEAGRARP